MVWGGGWFSDFRCVFHNLKRVARANLIDVYSHIFLFLLLIVLSPCKTKVAVWIIVSRHVANIFLIEGVVKGLLYCALLTRTHVPHVLSFCYISTYAVWDTSHTAENSPVWTTFMLAACIRELPALLRTQCHGLWPGILNSLFIFWFVIWYWIYA